MGGMNECTEPGMDLIQCTQTQGGIPTTPRSALGSWLIVPEGVALEGVPPILALYLRNGPGHRRGVRVAASGDAPPMKYLSSALGMMQPKEHHISQPRNMSQPKEPELA